MRDTDIYRQGPNTGSGTRSAPEFTGVGQSWVSAHEPSRNLDYLPQLARYARAGVDVASTNIGYGEMTREAHLALGSQMRRWIESQDNMMMAGTVTDIEVAKASDRLAITFDIEGAAAVEQLDDLETFHELGVRWVSMAYNRNNLYAGGCHDDDGGLTPAGRKLIARMEELGIAVCCSHTGYKSVSDVLDVATKPVILSHSNPRALHDHPRNVPDDLLKRIANSGGVVGVNGLKLFLGARYDTKAIALHVLYLVNLLGENHVGFGLDYVFDLDEIDDEKDSMASTFPPGLGYEDPVWCFDIDTWPDITAELMRAGLKETALRKILGGNWMRVAREVWA